MNDESTVNLEINGVALKARKGAMVIEVADQAGIRIPRFCYHDKLSIAANCRMCLVEVEKAPKPLPACATPVMEGMKVFTRSAKALEAQRGTMEFLLINHPLDCPICDQGGECELQDVAMGYGRDVSRYSEGKRVVADKNIGPLISTDMTRCIHCTRCVRFGQEIAGVMELGAPGRGENMRITTYVEGTVDSEMSGNVIDLCPVGALNAKPSRMTARAWELAQHAGVAAHDCIGSNLYFHTLRGAVNRVVPRDNESLNECWISDRDRFSYEGLKSERRLRTPMIRQHDQLVPCDWDTALQAVADGLRDVADRHGPDQLGALVSPNASVEEMYLLQRLVRGLGSNNIDHRLRQADFSGSDQAPLYPSLGQSVADLEALDALLLVGSNLRKEQPIAGHRVRKAALKGAKVFAVNSRAFEFNFPLAGLALCRPDEMIDALAGVLRALRDLGRPVDDVLGPLLDDAQPQPGLAAMAKALAEGRRAAVLLGPQAMAHPHFERLRVLADAIARASDANFGLLSDGANAAGAWLAGAVPHRQAGGAPSSAPGLDAAAMLTEPRRAFFLYGIEPEYDSYDPAATRLALDAAELVVVCTAFEHEALRDYAHVLLPIGAFAEAAGTWVNAEGRWQSATGAVAPSGDARPGWKVLRVLGNFLDLAGFDYQSAEQVRDELKAQVPGDGPAPHTAGSQWSGKPQAPTGLVRVSGVNPHAVDYVTRHAPSLQRTRDARDQQARINSELARQLGLTGAERALLRQGNAYTTVELLIDDSVADGCVWLPAGTPASARLGPMFGEIELTAE